MATGNTELHIEEFATLMEKVFGISVDADTNDITIGKSVTCVGDLTIGKNVTCAGDLTSNSFETTSKEGSISSEGEIAGLSLKSSTPGSYLNIDTNGGAVNAGTLHLLYNAQTGEFNDGTSDSKQTTPLMEGAQVYIANMFSKERAGVSSAYKEDGYGLLQSSTDGSGNVYSASTTACKVPAPGTNSKRPLAEWKIYTAKDDSCTSAGNDISG